MIYFGDVAARFVDKSWAKFLTHLVVYPVELLAVRLMPWSILLLAFASRRVREQLGRGREPVLFLTISILFSFLFVWLPPGSKVRYYMPLFPCFAALIGIAVDQLASLSVADRPILWTKFVQSMSYIMVGTAVVIVTTSVAIPKLLISLPPLEALGFAVVTLLLAYVAHQSWQKPNQGAMVRGIYCVATFMALVQVGLITTVQQRRCEDIEGHVKQIRQQLPHGTQLVSLGQVHHAFAFFYEQPIPIVTPTREMPAEVEYFCLHTYDCDPPALPFNWEKLAVVSCDRFKELATPKDRVFIGRRIPEPRLASNGTEESVNPPEVR
jgi:hypothetical protein